MLIPERITTEVQLDTLLAEPSVPLVAMMKDLDGDIMVLGTGGKIGVSLSLTAAEAVKRAGVPKKIIGVDCGLEPAVRQQLEAAGIQTRTCDLLQRAQVAQLPQVKNIIFMAGRKFGTVGSQDLTWAINVLVPANVAQHFRASRTVVFSTGCVYPLVSALSGGSTEADDPAPVGEYSQSCLGRERAFGYYSQVNQTPVCLFRLNYSGDLRYGVLHDIALKVWQAQPVDLAVGHFNIMWQGDVTNQALLALPHCATPPNILNVTGPETVAVRSVAQTFGKLMGKPVKFTGTEGAACYLSNSAKAISLFGYPRVPLRRLVEWTAYWLMAGGRSFNKPTHFEVKDGRF